MKKTGFTLAEVLITLTIIGVIAALTIPNLMQSYKKHQVEVGVKEAYSILSNALKMSQAENGDLDETLLQSGWIDKYLKPYLKVSKVYDYGSSRPYNTSAFLMVNGTYNLNAVQNTYNKNKWQLSNGMILLNYSDGWGQVFTIDLNGAKGPNKIGHDVFYFSLIKSGTGHCSDAGWDSVWCNHGNKLLGGTTSYEYYSDKTRGNGLKKCNEEQGVYCSANIMNNGWKIPDDYPIKKF